MEFPPSSKDRLVRTKSKKSSSSSSSSSSHSRSRPEAPISGSSVKPTSILPCNYSEATSTPLVFGDAVTPGDGKDNENVGGEASSFVFGASHCKSGTGTDAGTGTDSSVLKGDVTSRANEENENASVDTSPPPDSSTCTSTNTGTGTDNDGFGFSERSRERVSSSSNSDTSLWKGLLPKITNEVRKLELDHETKNQPICRDLPTNNEIKIKNTDLQNQSKDDVPFIFGTGGKTLEKEKSENYSRTSEEMNVNTNFEFSTSKISNSDQSTAKKNNRKKNKLRIGTAKSTYTKQPNSSEFLQGSSFSPSISSTNKYEPNKSPQINTGTEADCEKWRARGNQAYEKGETKTAEEYYTIGINSLSPDAKNRALMLCYSNRAASRMSLGRMRDALNDCLIASNIDSAFLKAQLRAANCFLALGDIEEAIKYYNKCLKSNSDPKISSEASNGLDKAQKVSELIIHAEEIFQIGKYDDESLEIISEALLICSHSDKLLKMKAEILLKMERYEEAIQVCDQNRNKNEKDSDSYIWRLNIVSRSYFYLGKLDEALKTLRKKQQSILDSSRRESNVKSSESNDSSFILTIQELIRLKGMGNEAFQGGKYNEAVEHYTSAFNVSAESRRFTAIILCNRAAAYQALAQIIDAIADCSLSIAIDSTYPKAFSRRAALYETIRDYGQACEDLQALISLLEKNQIQENKLKSKIKTNIISEDLSKARQRLLSAEEETKKGVPLNMYLILGVEPLTSSAEVKKAYRKAALKHHPDKAGQFLARNENVNDSVNKDADYLFKIIGEAYNVLSDSTKRARYENEEQKRTGRKK